MTHLKPSSFAVPRAQRTAHSAPLATLTVLFLLVNGAWFYKMGVMVDADTERFVGYAAELKERGFFYKPHDFWYIGYVGFLLLIGMVSPKLEAVVLVQYTLSYLALISLYYSSLRLFKNRLTALLTGTCFLGFVMLPFWNLYLYAESLYISLTCLSLFFLVKWHVEGVKTTDLIVGIIVIVWTILTKPTGVALLSALAAIGLYRLWKFDLDKRLKFGVVAIGGLGFLMLLNQMLGTFGFVADYQKGEVVYNIHKLSHMEYAKSLIIEAPANLYLPNEQHPTLWQFASLVLFNPLHSLKLFGTKLFYYLLYIRPYYSLGHNLLALIFLIPVYGLAFNKAINLKDNLAIFFWTYFLVCTLSPTLLTIDWNGRFLMPMLPMMFLAAGGGLSRLCPNLIPKLGQSCTKAGVKLGIVGPQ